MTRASALSDDLLRALAGTPAPSGGTWITRYTAPPRSTAHQFLVMLKPELTAEATHREPDAAPSGLLHRALGRLEAGGVTIRAARLTTAAGLARRRLIEQQYAVLNRVSRLGLEAVPAAGAERLARLYPEAFAAEATGRRSILGGHQLLDAVPGLTAYALDAFARNLPIEKVAAGVYALEMVLDGERMVVLNAFHPSQLDHFHRPGGQVVFLECLTDRPVAELRREVIGATDPAQAERGSVKELLHTEREAFRTWKVCTRLNGVHASPGAVEAMFTIQRCFSDDWGRLPLGDTQLGRGLLAAGLTEARIQALEHNPQIEVDGTSGPLFDVTEDMPVDEAFDLVVQLLRQTPAGVR
ncbi:hypothetical protein [Streptomyces sp. NPDC002588]|uniref:hypothetical protein n=1 Tax=Streptomyces sp. NPDC002588 TaxID=3154419 RepID=UPI00332DBF40